MSTSSTPNRDQVQHDQTAAAADRGKWAPKSLLQGRNWTWQQASVSQPWPWPKL